MLANCDSFERNETAWLPIDRLYALPTSDQATPSDGAHLHRRHIRTSPRPLYDCWRPRARHQRITHDRPGISNRNPQRPADHDCHDRRRPAWPGARKFQPAARSTLSGRLRGDRMRSQSDAGGGRTGGSGDRVHADHVHPRHLAARRLAGQIESVRVARSRRGGGIGTAMFEWGIAECRRRGCSLVQLFTDKSRKSAHRFYERLGFKASHEGMRLAR